MPLYDYCCEECDIEFEEILPVVECDCPVFCPKCGGFAKKIIRLGHGGIYREDPTWVKGVGEVFETKISTVKELRDFYQRNPNVRPKESHPALPSSIGDVRKPEDTATRRKRLIKQGSEYLQKKRAITVSAG